MYFDLLRHSNAPMCQVVVATVSPCMYSEIVCDHGDACQRMRCVAVFDNVAGASVGMCAPTRHILEHS